MATKPINNEWLNIFYVRTTAELILARTTSTTTHQWIITLSLAIVTSVLAFGRDEIGLNQNGFIALLVVLPLIFRYFVRSCLEYTIFHRWLAIRNAQDEYLQKSATKSQQKERGNRLKKVIQAYYFEHWSARPFLRMVRDNIMLSFYWPMLLAFSLTWFGVAFSEKTLLTEIGMRVAGIMLLAEVLGFIYYPRFKYKKI